MAIHAKWHDHALTTRDPLQMVDIYLRKFDHLISSIHTKSHAWEVPWRGTLQMTMLRSWHVCKLISTIHIKESWLRPSVITILTNDQDLILRGRSTNLTHFHKVGGKYPFTHDAVMFFMVEIASLANIYVPHHLRIFNRYAWFLGDSSLTTSKKSQRQLTANDVMHGVRVNPVKL